VGVQVPPRTLTEEATSPAFQQPYKGGVGPSSLATTGVGNNQFALAVGNHSVANPTDGNNNTAIAIGEFSAAVTGGTSSAPRANNSSAFVLGTNSTAVFGVIGNGSNGTACAANPNCAVLYLSIWLHRRTP
jgi:hypothetical protein